MTAVRWEGLTHAEIYARVQAGPGRGASLAVESAWADTEAMVHRIEERLAAAVARSGAGWEGAAGDAARSAVSPLGRWAADAAGDARLTATGVTAQAEQAAWLRSAMPSPTVPLWDEPSGRAAVDPLFLLQDTQALEQRSAADAAQAVHLMNTYTNNSYENRRLLDFWTLPPHVTADAGGPSPAPGGAGAGTAVARATGFGAIGWADGVGGPAGPGVSPAGAGRPGGPESIGLEPARALLAGGTPVGAGPVLAGAATTGPDGGPVFGGVPPGVVSAAPDAGAAARRPGLGPPRGSAPHGGGLPSPDPAADAARPAGAAGRTGSAPRITAHPGLYPPMAAAPVGTQGRERRRPDYLLDDTDAFADDRWFTPAVIGADDPPPPRLQS